MSLGNVVFVGVFIVFCTIFGEIVSSISNGIKIQQISTDGYNKANFHNINIQPDVRSSENVTIQVYYESFCFGCVLFETMQFRQVVEQLNKYLTIQTNPYGNTAIYEHNGVYTFSCQHGPRECYGNKLHACALYLMQNHTEAVLFNSCMMDTPGPGTSNDRSADKCGMSMNINTEPIKKCAKDGLMSSKLLKYYGDESKKANYNYLPYILVNGKVNQGDNFMRDVCAAFADPPPPCASFV